MRETRQAVRRRCVINPKASTLLVLIVVLVLAGCGSEDSTEPEMIIPDTPLPSTPRSTPLPEPTGEPPVGDEQRPITLLFAIPAGAGDDAALDELQDYLGVAGPVVQVQAANNTDALKALCSGQPIAAWISPFTLAVAQQQCNVMPVLAVIRDDSVGHTLELVARADADITAVSNLNGAVFCRSGQDNLLDWVFPSLIIDSAGVSPFPSGQGDNLLRSLADVQDVADSEAVAVALLDGECDVAAFAPGELEAIVDDLAVTGDVSLDDFTILVEPGETDVPADSDDWDGYAEYVLPYDVLVFAGADTIPDDVRQTITESLVDYFNNTQNADQHARALLAGDGVLSVQRVHFDVFQALVQNANWDMAMFN
jgi:ABC-type phosphate/phosphonate transport system substrate-binding protein